jgi:hypothetical protein
MVDSPDFNAEQSSKEIVNTVPATHIRKLYTVVTMHSHEN